MTNLLFITEKVLIKTKTEKEEPLTADDTLICLNNIIKIKNLIKLNYKIVLLDTNTNILKKKLCIKRLYNIIPQLENLLDIKDSSITFISNSISYDKLDNYYTLPNPGNIYEYLIDFGYNLRESALVGENNDISIKNLTGIKHFFNINDLE